MKHAYFIATTLRTLKKKKNLKNKTAHITQLAGGSHMDGYSLHLRDGGTKTLKCCLPPQQKEPEAFLRAKLSLSSLQWKKRKK